MVRKSGKDKSSTKPDAATKRWIRNASDEHAVSIGCKFDEARGQHAIDFAAEYLRLYEGDFAGEPLIARDWQIEATMRLFGWITFSERWNRWIRRFNRASIWIPKKNKKSPTLAWWSLYLLLADGEQGGKVFLGAKDGQQAREIAGKHALEMLQSSPRLMAECSINRNQMRITHEPSRSILLPLSSGDQTSQKAKEGLNGSLLIDETHVVDREFIARVSRLGISRSEPLHIEVSTAGKDPDSYGKSQYDRGKLVEAGRVNDPQFFFLCYEAPQSLSDDELASDPLKYGKLANPAWGHTIDGGEYLQDYNRSKLSVQDLADFKTYRLNIWQRSANPWLRSHDWDRCIRRRTLAEFEGRECWLALDKSKTRDMTAIVAVFRELDGEPDEFFIWPWFWLPQETARKNAHLAPFLDWGASGDLCLIPGEVIEDRYLDEAITDIVQRFRPQRILYDKTFAHDCTLRWEQEHGLERVEFPQTTLHFAGPVEDFERLVIQGKLHHADHPVLSWQAGHCQVHTDSKGRKTLVKPKHGDIKKIDGMVAGVMALANALSDDGGEQFKYYETHQLEMG